MNTRIFILAFLTFGFVAQAQLETSADFKRQVYDREFTFGISGHSRGYAINGRYLKFLDGFTKQGLELEFAKLRHPKEVKTPSQLTQNSRGYVYNRINSLFAFRAGYMRENILFDKTDQGTVSISLIYSGGLSLGLLKPIYVNFSEPGDPSAEPLRYDPPKHNLGPGAIQGEANFFRGIGETKLRPGLYGKVGVNFDYQLIESKVTSLEAGLIYDYYFREMEIFYESPNGEDINWAGFFQMYIQFNFGYRKN